MPRMSESAKEMPRSRVPKNSAPARRHSEKDDLLETALRKGSAGEVAADETHVPHARLRKTGILRTAALCRNMLQRRLGKRGSREAAVDKTDTKKSRRR